MSAKTSHRRQARAMRSLDVVQPLDLNAWSVIDAHGIQHTIYTLSDAAPEGFVKVLRIDA